MLLVAGGQLDPNLGALLRRVLARKLAFAELLVGPQLKPELAFSLDGAIEVDRVSISPTACFLRHDVFLPQRTGTAAAQREALNWFHAVKGWVLSRPDVRFFNRHLRRSDQGKFETLWHARRCGLMVPDTLVSNQIRRGMSEEMIRKPVAGGELTEELEAGGALPHPYLLQARLHRPELRIYRVGARLFGFSIESPDLDYRRRNDVRLAEHEVPSTLQEPFFHLCDTLGLDFAAGDFMSRGDGEWAFLEVNSQPMFAAFDKVADGRLSDAIIDWLAPEAAGAG